MLCCVAGRNPSKTAVLLLFAVWIYKCVYTCMCVQSIIPALSRPRLQHVDRRLTETKSTDCNLRGRLLMPHYRVH